MRGGNTRHTRNIRCVHRRADEFTTGSYPFAELWRDLCGVGTGPGNERLAELTVRESETVPAWMSAHGVSWQPPLAGTLHLGRTNRFFLGGGRRWSTPTTGPPSGWGSRSATAPRSRTWS